jgi:hypothetical protein
VMVERAYARTVLQACAARDSLRRGAA